jgi:tetratricopeptide (TPR) repeat protein
VASAAVLLVTAVVGLAAGLVAVNAERQRTEVARAAEAKRRQQAREALDALSSEVVDDWLAKQPELTDQQRQFLERALTSYEEFARDTGQDEQSRAGVAGAYGRVGRILGRLGKITEAEAAFRACQERFAQLAADYPAVPQYRQGLSAAHYKRAMALSDTGRDAEAEREYHAALDLLQRLADDNPGEAGDQHMRAHTHASLGNLLRGKGRLREAEEEVRAALALEQRLADEHRAVALYRLELASIRGELGHLLLLDKGRLKEAVDKGRLRAPSPLIRSSLFCSLSCISIRSSMPPPPASTPLSCTQSATRTLFPAYATTPPAVLPWLAAARAKMPPGLTRRSAHDCGNRPSNG